MNLSNLRPAKGSVKQNKRVGRGEGSGTGGTARRGHKGAKSRSGYSRKRGFEGGQMPLQRRVPKFGFKNNKKVIYVPVNLDMLEKLAEEKGTTDFDLNFFQEHGLASKRDKVKVLGRGELTKALNVSAHSFSESAEKAIAEKGGTTNQL